MNACNSRCRLRRSFLLSGALLLALGACSTDGAAVEEGRNGLEVADVEQVAIAPAAEAPVAGEDGPPLGKYVCRQYTTTMGYLTLVDKDTYEVSGKQGSYRFDPATGEMNWQDGSYAEWGWDATYEHVSREAGDGRPDEDIIRIVSEADGLKIDCYKMAED